MKGSTKSSKNQEGTTQGTCTMKDLHFNVVCTTWNAHFLLDNFEHKKVQDCIVKKISIPCNKQMLSNKGKKWKIKTCSTGKGWV